MSKKITALVLAAAVTVGFVGISFAAKKLACEVQSVEGTTVTLTCTKTGALKAGDKVKVAADVKKAVEGC